MVPTGLRYSVVNVLSGAASRNMNPTAMPANIAMIIQPAKLILRFFCITIPPKNNAHILAYSAPFYYRTA